MEKRFIDILQGYRLFREKYVLGDSSIMHSLSSLGQQPQALVVACCDSRVDPALILQCDPGDLFVVRNVANIVPPYEKDIAHHGTSAALEFGIRFLHIENLILLGHNQCSGIQTLLEGNSATNDFISNWVSIIDSPVKGEKTIEEYAQSALYQSYLNCLTFPWIKEKIESKSLAIHLWFFDIKNGEIVTYSHDQKKYLPLNINEF